jgi:hypothetical protein
LRELAAMKQKGDALKKANDKKEKDLKEAEKRIAKLKQIEKLKNFASEEDASPRWKNRGDEE